MSKELELVGLPADAKVEWANIFENAEDHICDEDMAWVKLSNGISIDAGQYYPESPFFRVDVIAPGDGWKEVESVICRHTQEVANEIVRLANKYMDPWYAAVAEGYKDPSWP